MNFHFSGWMRGPMMVSSSLGSPTFRPSARRTRASQKGSYPSPSTMMREVAMHTCPWWQKAP